MVHLHKPRYEDLWFREMMLSDPETMAYNRAWGGTISFAEERWGQWFSRWVEPGTDGFFYRYLADDMGRFVGEVAYHLEDVRCMADVIVHAPFRGRGYGREGLELLLNSAREHGFSAIYDDISADNPSISLFKKTGFVEQCRTGKAVTLRRSLV